MEEKYGVSTKRFMLEELAKKFAASPNFMITNYKGLSSLDVEALRKELGKSRSRYTVVKNSIVKKVFEKPDLKGIDELVKGETGVGFLGDVIGASKAFVDFSKKHPSLKLKAAFIDGKIESLDRIKHLAALPPKEVLLSLVISYMKSPITGFVGVLSGCLRKLVYAINEIKKKKEGGKENG